MNIDRHTKSSWLNIAPLAIVLFLFFVLPMTAVVTASILEDDGFGAILPVVTFANYADVFSSSLTWKLYLSTAKFTLITWAITAVLGFWISYFLVFHVKNKLLAIGLFLLCTIPFWTSNIIRMISWIPLLGKEGLINSALIGSGFTSEPLEFLLFSDFAVVVAYVHQLTIFMIVPIFNSMARVESSVLEAAKDCGASKFDIVRLVVFPLSKSGIALGSIFCISLTMGDFFVVKVMSGGGSASVVGAMFEDIGILLYPTAAAHAVVLMIVVTLLITMIIRAADIRKEIVE